MRHRHLDYPPETPVAELGPAALEDLLDRGDLDAWRPVLREIKRDPHGPVADRVLGLAAANPLAGTARLLRTWVERQRGGSAKPAIGPALKELRARRGLTQKQVAQRLGSTQPEVSKLERRDDLRLRTLHAYAAALGGSLEVRIRFPDGDPSEWSP